MNPSILAQVGFLAGGGHLRGRSAALLPVLRGGRGASNLALEMGEGGAWRCFTMFHHCFFLNFKGFLGILGSFSRCVTCRTSESRFGA